MTTHLVTFSDESMSRAAELCVESARRNGVDLPTRYVPAQPSSERGYGFWRWKPQIIHSLLMGGDPFTTVNDGEFLIYSDAGVELINNVNYIIDRMDQDIFLFGNNWEHAHWCKADVPSVILGQQRVTAGGVQNWLWQDHPKHDVGCACRAETVIFGKQVQASAIFFRVSDYTRKFVKEWLDWCLFEDGRLIDDSPSRTPNHPEFREHRHDQSILTTLAYREGIKLHYWPASYNDGAFSYEKLPEYAGDDYPILFNHHRRRDHEWVKCA